MIVLDTSIVLALKDAGDERHGTVADWYRRLSEDLATTPLVLAEVDLAVRARLGAAEARSFRRDVASGALTVEWWERAAAESCAVAERYADLALSLADASLVALAARLGTIAVATLDHRHFRAVRPLTGEAAFRLLPADA